MSKFKSQGFLNTFKNARRGFRLVVKSEPNIRVHLVVAALVLILAFTFQMNSVKICILLIAIAQVIVAEMLNTGLEFSIDAVFKNKYSKLVGMAKDIAAAAVMCATFISIVIGVVIFGAEILNRCGVQLYGRLQLLSAMF